MKTFKKNAYHGQNTSFIVEFDNKLFECKDTKQVFEIATIAMKLNKHYDVYSQITNK
jgi:hypothetical protein